MTDEAIIQLAPLVGTREARRVTGAQAAASGPVDDRPG